MSKTQKQAFILIGTLIATFIVLLLANQLHIDSFWLNPILIFTILTVKSENILQRILGASTFIIFAIGLFFQLTYVGFLSAAINLAIMSAIAYVYDDTHDTIISSLTDKSERVVPGRWNAIFFGLIMLVFSMIPYIMLDYIWDGTILELGGKTAIIYGLTLVCEYISKNQETNAQKIIEYKRQKEQALSENQTAESPTQVSGIIKFLAVWMIVLDLSIFSYLFNQSQSGFNLAMIATIITIVLISFIQAHENKEDVLNIVYTWLRPFQATALLVLLISYEKTVNLTIFYIILILIVHALWMVNKITIKTTLITSSIILFIPLIGYLSNPYRFINEETPDIQSVLFEKNNMPLSSFTLSDFWKENEKLNISNDEFYKRLNDQNTDDTKRTTNNFDNTEWRDRKENLKQEELPINTSKKARTHDFVRKFNDLYYSTRLKDQRNDSNKFLFYKIDVVNDAGEHDIESENPILAFDIRVKQYDRITADTLDSKVMFEEIEKYNQFQDLLNQLTKDGAIKENDLEDGEYSIKYRVFDQNDKKTNEWNFKTKITKGVIEILK